MFHNVVEDDVLLRIASQMLIRKGQHEMYYNLFRDRMAQPTDCGISDRARRLADRSDVRVSLLFSSTQTGDRVEVARMSKFEFYCKLLISFDRCLRKIQDVREVPDSILCALTRSCVVNIRDIIKQAHGTTPCWITRYMAPGIIERWKRRLFHNSGTAMPYEEYITRTRQLCGSKTPLPLDVGASLNCFRITGDSEVVVEDVPVVRRIHPYRMSMSCSMVISEFLYTLNRSMLLDSDVVHCNWCVSNHISLLLPQTTRSATDLICTEDFKIVVLALYQRVVALCCGNRSMEYLLEKTRLPCLSCEFSRCLVSCIAYTVTGIYEFDERINSVRERYGRLIVSVNRPRHSGGATDVLYAFPVESRWCTALKCFYQCEGLIQVGHCRDVGAPDAEPYKICKIIPFNSKFTFPGKDCLKRTVRKYEDAGGFTLVSQYSEWTKMLRGFSAVDFISCSNPFSRLRLAQSKDDHIESVHNFTVGMKYFKHLTFTRRVLDAMNYRNHSALAFGAPMDMKDNMLIDDVSAELVNFEGYVGKTLSPAANKIDPTDALHLVKMAYSAGMLQGSSHTAKCGQKLFPTSITSLGVDYGQSSSLQLTFSVDDSTLGMLQNVLPIRSCGRPDQWADAEVMPYPGFIHFTKAFLFGADEELEQALLWLGDRLYRPSRASEAKLRLIPRGHPAFGMYRMLVFLVNGFPSKESLFGAMQSVYKKKGMLVNSKATRRKRRMGVLAGGVGDDNSPANAPAVEGSKDCYGESDIQSVVSCEYYDDRLDSEAILGEEDNITFSGADLFEEDDEPVASMEHVDLSVENLAQVRDSLLRLIEKADELDGVVSAVPSDAQKEAMIRADGAVSFSNTVRNAYNILRPFLSPYDVVYADYSMLSALWNILLYDETLWIDHSPLVCLLIEMMDFNYECLVQKGEMIPSWQAWIYYRKRYVKSCLEMHGRQKLGGPLDEDRQGWCVDSKKCPYCVLVSCKNHVDSVTYRAREYTTFWLPSKTHRRVTGALMSETNFSDDPQSFMDWCMELDDDHVGNPLCHIPPRPSDDDVHEWENCFFKTKGDYSKKRHLLGEATDLMVPKEMYTIPDLPYPPHFLFYMFACDPRVSASARTGIMAGLRSNNVMPLISPCCNPVVGKSAEIFHSGCEKLAGYVADIHIVEEDEKDKHSRYQLADFSSWIKGGFKAFAQEDVGSRLLPANMLMHLAFLAEAFSNLPYDPDVERASRINPSAGVCYGRGVLRSNISMESVESMYDNQKCMALVCDRSRELPLGYRIVKDESCTHDPGAILIHNDLGVRTGSLMNHKSTRDCCLYEIQTLTKLDCLPVWESPYDIVGDNNTLDRGPYHKTMTDNLLSRRFFDSKSRLPRPFSMANDFLFDLSINMPMIYFDMTLMEKYTTDRESRIQEPAASCLGKRPSESLGVCAKLQRVEN